MMWYGPSGYGSYIGVDGFARFQLPYESVFDPYRKSSFSITCEKESKLDQVSKVKYVNPFIGTAGHGHTYPGATVPFGMLQVSPDNGISKWDWCSGYHYSDSITIGFSHLHLSGTGIGDLADVRLMPINKKVDLTKEVKSRDDIPYKSTYSHLNETAKPGYYSVDLKDFNIKTELTSSLRTANHKYTFDSVFDARKALSFSLIIEVLTPHVKANHNW